jgi:hypothetical protein
VVAEVVGEGAAVGPVWEAEVEAVAVAVPQQPEPVPAVAEQLQRVP